MSLAGSETHRSAGNRRRRRRQGGPRWRLATLDVDTLQCAMTVGLWGDDGCGTDDHAVDTADHMFRECPIRNEEREQLCREVSLLREDMVWDSLLPRVTADVVGWQAFAKFCDSILGVKEETERDRERRGIKGRGFRGRRRRRRPPDLEIAGCPLVRCRRRDDATPSLSARDMS
ncbi:hypothetical protein RUM44_014044 [Polyplax serrata]|uniref:Uncharacterized protein n=1 Tax=Polyplax serrata TaxID=468196 RepID=A0ABR1BJI5_POLSC